MKNVGVSVKNQMIGVLSKIICQILVYVIVSVLKRVKLTTTQILKIVHTKNVIGKLALECEDEISNTAKKETYKKNNCLIHRFHQHLYACYYQLLLAAITITQEMG